MVARGVTDPRKVNLVLYHHPCPDGFGSAYAAWTVLGDGAEYVGCSHGMQHIPDVKGKRVVICDFSFKSNILQEMVQDAEELLVIDHHASAARELDDLPAEYKQFDMTHSGAILTWNFFHPHEPAPPLLQYVEDRDLWTWTLPNSTEVCLGLDTFEQSFPVWHHLDVETCRKVGEPIVQWRKQLTDSVVATSVESSFEGVKCRIVNASGGPLISYVGDAILRRHNVPLALIWYYDGPSQEYKVSMRAKGVDCSYLAVKYGGGGHPNASAFRTRHLSTIYQ